MEILKPPMQMKFVSNNVAENWRRFERQCEIGSKSAMQVGKLLHTVSHCLLLMHECDMVSVSAGIVVRCGETVTGK